MCTIALGMLLGYIVSIQKFCYNLYSIHVDAMLLIFILAFGESFLRRMLFGIDYASIIACNMIIQWYDDL